MSESDEEAQNILPPPRKKRRFVFKKLAQRIAEVDVDVYRQLQPVRATPLPGASSFFQEELDSWRELNTGEHFLQAAVALHPLTQSLPLLIHHKEEVVQILLEGICMKATHSLEALLSLLGSLARDLQADYLPYVPRIFTRLADLVDEGAENDPEVLRHLFACVASVCKNLAKQLAANFPRTLKVTSRLRNHAAAHVRRLAASALAFLLRHATNLQMRTAARIIFAEQAWRPTQDRTEGAGLLLAEAVKSVSHGLHSKAPQLVAFVLQPRLLSTSDLKTEKAAIDTEVLQSRAQGVIQCMLSHILDHGRRGKLHALWEALWEAAERDVMSFGVDGANDARRAARTVSLLAHAISFHNGSRVEDFEPAFRVAAHLCSPNSLALSIAAGEEANGLAAHTLDLLTAILRGHCREMGASQGLRGMRRHAFEWRSIFEVLPSALVLPFLQSLLSLRSSDLAAVFAPDALQALCKALVSEDGRGSADDHALPLLAEFCRVAAPQEGALVCKPMLEAIPDGKLMVKRICGSLRGADFARPSSDQAEFRAACASALAEMRCLPFASNDTEHVADICDSVLAAAEAAMPVIAEEQAAALLCVIGAATTQKAAALEADVQRKPTAARIARLRGMSDPALRLLNRFPASFAILRATAAVLAAASRFGGPPEAAKLEELFPVLEANMTDRSQAMRRESLRVLTACQQSTPTGKAEGLAGNILCQFLQLEEAPVTPDAGRAAAVALQSINAALEFGKVPSSLVAPTISALIGLLHIRLSLVWGPSSVALGTALQHQPESAWPRVIQTLKHVQQQLLAGNGAGIMPRDDESATHSTSAFEMLDEAMQAGSPSAGEGATDASVRLSNLLKAVARAPNNSLQARAKDWVPVFLVYVAAKTGAEDDEDPPENPEADQPSTSGRGDGVTPISLIGSRVWRSHLKEWLSVISMVKSPKGLYNASRVRLSVALQLTDAEPGVQQAVLNCLRSWKIKYLNGYVDRLIRLSSNNTLREELAAFPLAKDADDKIPAECRPGLISVLVRVLWPKMRKRGGRLGGKGAPGSARSAILNFLAAAEPHELAPMLLQFMRPLSAAFRRPIHLQTAEAKVEDEGLFDDPWWAPYLGAESSSFWLEVIDTAQLKAMELRARMGFLNATSDLLQHLGYRLQPYLPDISALLLAVLETVPFSETESEAKEGRERVRDVRSSALRLLAAVWQRYPGMADFNPLWLRFFRATAPILERLPTEAAADRAPAILEVISAFAASPHLLPLLADRSSQDRVPEGDSAVLTGAVCKESWAAKDKAGSRLLGAAVAMLAAPTCSAAAQDAGLGVIESILDFGQDTAEPLLAPHIDALLEALRVIAVASTEGPGSSKRSRAASGKGHASKAGGRVAAMRALSILEALAAQDYSPETSEQLVDALLPLLTQKPGRKQRAHDGEVAMLVRTLSALAAIWRRQACTESQRSHEGLLSAAEALAPLAGRIEEGQAATALSSAFEALANLAPGLKPAAELLHGLTAMSQTEIDQVDYEGRLAAFRQLTPEKWREVLAVGGVHALIHRVFVHLRSSDDLALRHAAAQALAKLLQAVAEAGGAESQSRERPAETIITRVVLPNVRRSIAAVNLAVRQEHLTLLRSLAVQFPDMFRELRVLADVDVEVDFFANIAHLQMHRRARALNRLSKTIREGKVGPGTVLEVALPLVSQMIVEGRAAESAGHELKAVDKDRGANVADVAVGVLSDMAANMEWPHYQQLLSSFLRAMQRQTDTKKAVIRAVCTIIDAFHFELPAVDKGQALDGAAPETEALASEAVEDDMDVKKPEKANANRQAHINRSADILRALTKRILPALESALMVETGLAVRPPVALALVKLLLLLPPQAARPVLPRVLQGVANLLRNRLQHVRDDARNVLAAMAAELGPQYLPFVLDVVESALPQKGYMGHIHGYTLHFIFEAVGKDMEAGSIDESLPRILSSVESQLFGAVGEEKEAGVLQNTREAKKMRAYDTYQLLAQLICFRTSLVALLQPVRSRLREAASPAIRSKLVLLLEAAQRGLASNTSATPEDLLVFVSGVFETVIPAEAAAVAEAEAAAEAAARGDGLWGKERPAAGGESSRHQHLLLVFALGLVQRGLKKGSLGGRSPAMLGMLDPLLPRLVEALQSRHSAVVEHALKIFSYLVHLPLPGLASAAPGAGEAMTTLLQKAPSTSTRIAQECLRLLAGLLRECPEWAPTTSQLRFLITWALSDVEAAAAGVGAFTLLRSVIKRKLLLPEVYDVMSKVQDLVIRAQSASVRQLCSSTLLQFLLDYPLGEKRFREHVNFLAANLTYEHESGRLAAIDLLSVLASKLPADMLAAYAPVFFMPLVMCMVGDQSAACRKDASQALEQLLKVAGLTQRKKFAEYCSAWLRGNDVRLRRAALQAYGVLAEVEEASFGLHIRAQLPHITRLLAQHVTKEGAGDAALEDADEGSLSGSQQAWQEAYYALLLLTRVMRHCPIEMKWTEGGAVVALWRTLPGLILHQHLWVRKLTADLFGLAFLDTSIWPKLLEDEAGRPPRLAALFYRQLEASKAKEANLAQSAKCLIFLAAHLKEAPRPPDRGQDITAQGSDEEADDDDEEVHAYGAGSFARGKLSLMGLVRRVARLADDHTFPRQLVRLTALRLLAALATRLGPEDIAPFLTTMLKPLFRITEGLTVTPQEVKDLAQEVMSHIREVAGADALITSFNAARQAVTTARADRKRKQAVQAMLDPGASARSKLQKQSRRAAGRKRKMEEMARKREVGIPVKNRKAKKGREA